MIRDQLPPQHPVRQLLIDPSQVRKKLSDHQLDDLLTMIGAKDYIRLIYCVSLVVELWLSPLVNLHTGSHLSKYVIRYHRTEFSESAVLVVVRKFGKATLEEEATGRTEHVVSITAKRFTKALERLPKLQQFYYDCSCKSSKTFCIHLSLVLMSDFADAE